MTITPEGLVIALLISAALYWWGTRDERNAR